MVQSSQLEQHTIIALVGDKPGVLTRIASMFRRRGFNIASLAVGRSEKPGLSRMTFVVHGDLPTVQQVTRQLDKLIDVIQVSYISTHQVVARELALMKVTTTPSTRGEIMQFTELFSANIVDVGSTYIVIEITGGEQKVDGPGGPAPPLRHHRDSANWTGGHGAGTGERNGSGQSGRSGERFEDGQRHLTAIRTGNHNFQ